MTNLNELHRKMLESPIKMRFAKLIVTVLVMALSFPSGEVVSVTQSGGQNAVGRVTVGGGVLPALAAIGSVAGGTAAATTATTVAAGAFIGSGAVLYGAVWSADYSSAENFADSANWGTVGFTAGGAALGAGMGYLMSPKQRLAEHVKKNVRDDLLGTVQNDKLKNAVNEIYRPGATTGDGGLADAVRYELSTGELVGGKSHIQKAVERITNLENIIKRQELSPSDLEIANRLLNDLKKALGGK